MTVSSRECWESEALVFADVTVVRGSPPKIFSKKDLTLHDQKVMKMAHQKQNIYI